MKTRTYSVRLQNQSGDVQDKFCWTCHKKGQTISCPKCFRSYHERCLRSTANCCWNDEDNSLVSCTVCTVKETSKEASVGKQPLLDMLKYTMVDISNNPDFQVFKDFASLKMVAKNCDDVVNPIDLNEINDENNNRAYGSFYAFLVDIEGIVHNCYALLGEFHELTKNAINLFKFCERQTRAISNCAECYENKHLHPNKWRTMACSKPHLVLLARLNRSLNFLPFKKGFTHWPAKLIGVNDDKLQIIFFDGPEFIDISAKDCWTYTKHLSSMKRYFDLNNIKTDLEEVDLYAKNIEKKFVRFKKELPCIRFNQHCLNDHIIRMFPDYNNLTKIVLTKYRPIDYEVDECPAKRPRLTADNTKSPSDSSTKATTIKKCMRIIEHKITELVNDNDSKLQEIMNELDCSKEALDDAREANKKIVADLQSVSSERDQTKEMLVRSNEIHASEIATINEAHRQKASELNNAKAELIKAKEDHIKETEALNELHNQNMVNAKKDIERILAEKMNAEVRLRKATREHDIQMRNLREQLHNNNVNSLMNLETKLNKEHNDELNALRKEHEEQLKYEKNRINAEIEKLEMEQREKMATLKNRVKASLEENVSSVFNNII